jgi:hypothetical protein
MFARSALKSLPAWSQLSSKQRQQVWRDCVRPILMSWQMILAKTLLPLLAFIAGARLHAFETLLGVLLVLGGVMMVSELMDFILLRRKRHEVQRYIKRYDDD